MRFIDDHQVPRRGMDIGSFATSKLIRANDDCVLVVEGTKVSELDSGIVGFSFEDGTREEKLLVHLLMPLLAQV